MSPTGIRGTSSEGALILEFKLGDVSGIGRATTSPSQMAVSGLVTSLSQAFEGLNLPFKDAVQLHKSIGYEDSHDSLRTCVNTIDGQILGFIPKQMIADLSPMPMQNLNVLLPINNDEK